MKEKTDRRILRTRSQLREVLLHLTNQKPIESITIKELTDQAGLNRGTFYLHYQDINDFINQFKNEILDQYYAIIKKLGHHHKTREPFIDPPSGYLRPFEYVMEHKHFFQVFMGSNGDPAFSLSMKELLNQQFQNSYLLYHRKNKVEDIPVKHNYLFAYLSSAYVGSIQLWIQRDFDLSPHEMAVLFSEISRLGSAHLHEQP